MESKYNPSIEEPAIQDFWERERIFAFDDSSDKPVFSIDTPPPTVSGDLHMGHVFSYSQAEFIARYKRMRGFNVFYPFGLDNNGLPTELLIEKKFNIIAEDLGRNKFVELVQKEIQYYNESYIALFKRLGLSIDWSLTYQTISEEVQKISQKSFIELYKSGRIVRKESPVLYCPKCRTVVSQMELEDKPMKSKLVYVKFSDDLIIATTRPELIPACVGIFVNPKDERYAKIVNTTVKVPITGHEVKVFADDSIRPDFGTGAEMCCTFGDQNDIALYKAYGLDLRLIIDDHGLLTVEPYKGLSIKDARTKIIEDLKAKGLVLKEEDIEHSVNVHERCGTEIEYLIKKQWYVAYLDLKDKFIEQGRKIKWYPEYMRVRYENWVNGLKWDWCISRQRYFGVYFPLWYCKACGRVKLADEADIPVNPFTDKPKGKCECGSDEFVPETDIMDTWATSSLTPLINARWGLDNKYIDKIYPMSMRANAYEIISFWDFTSIVKSLLHTNTIPWENLMISGQGLDQHGKPMHKSHGNVVDPWLYINKYGADAVRYWASSSVLGENNSFQEKEVIAGSRLSNKIWNLARLISMTCADYEEASPRSALDAYFLSELKTVIAKATEYFEAYDYFKARNTVEEFFWKFANDYVEFVKKRIYANDNDAKYAINTAFIALLKLFAPFMPFVTEKVYQSLYKQAGEKSIHVSEWPNGSKISVVDSLAEEGKKAYDTILFIRQWKHNNKLALNAPIASVSLIGISESAFKDITDAMNIGMISTGVGDNAEQIPGTDIKIKITLSNTAADGR
ncbi:MAG: valine--tRNA ligase [Candidatus Micrarchaeaceae archaeon]